MDTFLVKGYLEKTMKSALKKSQKKYYSALTHEGKLLFYKTESDVVKNNKIKKNP